MGNNSIKTIKLEELMASKSMPEGMQFFIPKYQRGYRWKETQITQLLDDIDEFEYEKGNEDKFYCMQPLVVKRGDDGSWVVVDGQQRLTTIFIIMSCIHKKVYKRQDPIYTLNYENKGELWNCVSSLGDINIDVEVDDTDIDKYHVTSAYKTVDAWLDDKDDFLSVGGDIREKLRAYTRFIWYEIDDDNDPETIFTNINMGKIKLTNAELIKALLLKKDNYRKDEKAEDIISSQIRISTAWDNMEATLHDKDVWLFLTNDYKQQIDTRMELIFKIMTFDILKKYPEFYDQKEMDNNQDTYTFIIINKMMEKKKSEDKNAKYADILDSFWKEITRYYNMFMDWYNMREWYHLIGFLLAKKDNHKGKIFDEEYFYNLCDLYHKSTKTEFIRKLKDQILLEIDPEMKGQILTSQMIDDYVRGLSYDSKDKDRIHQILLLFNVISMQISVESEPRFPFRRYKDQRWNLEHIHSVTTEHPTNAVERKEWLLKVKDYVDVNKNIPDSLKAEIETFIATDNFSDEKASDYEKIFNQLVAYFAGYDISTDVDTLVDNEIKNLTLLDEKTNKGYKNAIFPIKRNVILSKSEVEDFIPICTRNVFLKAYSSDVTQMFIWSPEDGEAYVKKMISTIFDYMKSDDVIGGVDNE